MIPDDPIPNGHHDPNEHDPDELDFKEPEPDEPDEPLGRLSRDLRKAARLLTPAQARYLVDIYYQMQAFRIESANQVRSSNKAGEPTEFVAWVADTTKRLEGSIKAALDVYSDGPVAGRWAKSIYGIGPVIAAGLLAHIDPVKARTAGAIWRFAGLDPTVKWNKGEKRPWNAKLKVLCWKIGESFVKFHGREECTYGKMYAERKQQEETKNAAGAFSDQAALVLTSKRIGKDTKARKFYEAGQLPPGHVHARAKRWAVKLFLSHYQWVLWESTTGTPPPRPYVIEHLGHTDLLRPPNWPMV